MKFYNRYKIFLRVIDKETLSYIQPFFLSKKFLCIVLVFILLLFSIPIITIYNNKIEIKRLENIQTELLCEIDDLKVIKNVDNLHRLTGKFIIEKSTETPNIDTLSSFLNKCNAWYPDIIAAQAILESATFTSYLYNQTYNMFGMRKPLSRETTSLNTYDKNYANYYNWQLSVIDRIHWDLFIFKGKKPTRDEYLNKLGMIYAEEPTYLQRIDSVIKKNNL